MNITDPIRQHAQATPDATAIIRANGRMVSYRELDRVINFVAARVRSLGLGPGDIVEIRTSQPYRDLCFRLALARLGICVAPQSMPAGAITACLTDDAMPQVPGTRFERIGRLWIAKLSPSATVPDVPSHQDGAALCVLSATSGTTGTRRCVPLSHELMARRLAVNLPADLQSGGIRQICTVGVGTAYGFRSRISVLWSGGVIVLTTDADRILDAIDRFRVNRLVVAPVTLQRLLPGLAPDFGPLPSLQQIEFGGSALPDHLHDSARRHLCPNIESRYGATETGYMASAPIESLRGHPGAVGYVDPRVEVQAVDADDQPLPPGTEGTLRVRSAHCASAYHDDPVASARVFRGGWVYHGDVGIVAPDRLLTVTGRANDVINQGGIKVNPGTIEDVLLSMAGIDEAAAFGAPDATGVVRIWAAIVSNGPVDMAAVKDLCRERLKHRAPTQFLQLKALPRNEAGKVLRDQLRKRAIAGS